MLKIAYCDDEQKERDKLMQALSHIEEKWGENFVITSFNNGESLLKALDNHNFDVVFLDILMDGIDGVKTAKSMRTLGIESKIVFISSCSERIRELFSVGTVAFLDKPFKLVEIERVLKQIIDIMNKDKQSVFTFKSNKDVCFLQLSEIKYFESKRQEIYVQTIKEQVTYYGTLKQVLVSLQRIQRLSCHIDLIL